MEYASSRQFLRYIVIRVCKIEKFLSVNVADRFQNLSETDDFTGHVNFLFVQ